MNSHLSRIALLAVPALVVCLSVACSSSSKDPDDGADDGKGDVTPDKASATTGGTSTGGSTGKGEPKGTTGGSTTAGTPDAGPVTPDASTTTLTCSPIGSCLQAQGGTCQDWSSSLASGAGDFQKSCASTGTYSAGTCARTGSVGGCALDTSTATICFQSTTWFFPPQTADNARQACELLKGTFVAP